MDFHMDDNSAPSLRIATALSTLTCLDLLPQTSARRERMLAVLSHLQGVHDPFKLDWLQHSKALQHLAVPLMQTGQVRSNLGQRQMHLTLLAGLACTKCSIGTICKQPRLLVGFPFVISNGLWPSVLVGKDTLVVSKHVYV
jgi:hypothetical protein